MTVDPDSTDAPRPNESILPLNRLDATLDAAPSMDEDPRVIAAAKAFMDQIKAGKSPKIDDFVGQYPEIAKVLRPCLEGLMLLGAAIGDVTHDMPLQSQSTFSAQSLANDSGLPTALGDFRIVCELGRGGMGIVYEAEQLSLGRRVALKVLSFASGLDPVRLQRFRNEAQAAAQLHHTHIVPVYAVGSDRGVHYYAMQLIEGSSLSEVIQQLKVNRTKQGNENTTRTAESTKNTPAVASANIHSQSSLSTSKGKPVASVTRDAVAWDSTELMSGRGQRSRYFRNLAKMIMQAARGLSHAHLYGVIHRDIKPANLLLDHVGNIWITDFGLAQVQSDNNLTKTGDVLGTLRYMSPEQAAGGSVPVDHRADIYSLGVTFYELLTLQPAIVGSGYQEILSQISDKDPPAPRQIDSNIPVELETIVQKSISKNPLERYATAEQLADDLQRWLDDKPILAKPPTLVQRVAKWRRRHAGIVNAAIAFSVLASVVLLGTTIAIYRAERGTAAALASERTQRNLAETNFRQAKRAVDTFSELSETELSIRPDLRSLRRDFLETSLQFYQDFIEASQDDVTLSRELEATSQRVELLVQNVKLLDNVEPLELIQNPSVVRELGLESDQVSNIQKRMEQMQEDVSAATQQKENSEQVLLSAMGELTALLTPQQWKRLKEIHRQFRLPFTFKSSEIVAELELSLAQRREISTIIEQERPDFMRGGPGGPGGPGGGKFAGRPNGQFGGPFGPPRDGPIGGRGGAESAAGGFGPPGPPPDLFGGEPFPFEPPPGEPPLRESVSDEPGSVTTSESKKMDDGKRRNMDPRRRENGPPDDMRERIASQTKKTVERIIEILTPEQKSKWEQLIGAPFVIR